MIKQPPYGPSATLPTAASAPATRTDEPTTGKGTAGKATAAEGTAGKETAGKNAAGEGIAGKETAGNDTAGQGIAGNEAAGKDTVKGIELGKQIGHRLKAMFEDVVAEPVPEKFRALLEDLERKSGKS